MAGRPPGSSISMTSSSSPTRSCSNTRPSASSSLNTVAVATRSRLRIRSRNRSNESWVFSVGGSWTPKSKAAAMTMVEDPDEAAAWARDRGRRAARSYLRVMPTGRPSSPWFRTVAAKDGIGSTRCFARTCRTPVREVVRRDRRPATVAAGVWSAVPVIDANQHPAPECVRERADRLGDTEALNVGLCSTKSVSLSPSVAAMSAGVRSESGGCRTSEVSLSGRSSLVALAHARVGSVHVRRQLSGLSCADSRGKNPALLRREVVLRSCCARRDARASGVPAQRSSRVYTNGANCHVAAGPGTRRSDRLGNAWEHTALWYSATHRYFSYCRRFARCDWRRSTTASRCTSRSGMGSIGSSKSSAR